MKQVDRHVFHKSKEFMVKNDDFSQFFELNREEIFKNNNGKQGQF